MSASEQVGFRAALRGYARADVDAHVARTDDELAELREQALDAERAREAALEEATRLRAELHAALDEVHRLRADDRTVPLKGTFDPYPTDPIEPRVTSAALAVAAARSGSALPPAGAERDPHPTSPLGRPHLDAPTPHPPLARPELPVPSRPPRRRLGWLWLVPLLALVAAVASVLLLRGAAGQQEQVNAPLQPSVQPPAAPEPVPSPARPPAEAAPLPARWTTERAPDGSWTIGLPPGWRAVGQDEERRYVSESGLTTMWVRTGDVGAPPGPAAVQQFEEAFAADRPGYRRRAAAATEHRGFPARTWDYTYGSGAEQRRGSDLGVVADGRGYWLHVESRASAWQFAEPLVGRFRDTFVPS